MKVLIIDDSEPTRVTIAKLMRASGKEVLEAENGAVGLSILRNEHVDFVLLDMVMPEMDGLTFLERANEERLLEGTPVGILTGSAVKNRLVDWANGDGIKGVNFIFQKPLCMDRVEELLIEMERAVLDHRARSPLPVYAPTAHPPLLR